ncbi:hypothetical protein GQ55_1G180300 [Panicum hallii var. hallii]|uniref:Sodium/metabolite cotransporter BASS3, chloroplastic n=1 Tax=Panicum hallii var. hallii TaxID=1504633 RepID=A0A2T7F649_9POAL|nr:hypothetical protein GQ55_1G180300 [Panicum hallii var. hallii]
MAAAASCSHPPFSPAASLHHQPHHVRRCGATPRFSPLPPPPPPPRALLRRRPRRLAPTTFCSAPSLPRLGRVGWPRREGNAWLLSFRGDTAAAPGAALGDPSKALSALLPLVVAATAVAALGNPATFSWVNKDYYAPALGGIMLSIGIKLSVDDFALAFKRPVPLSIGYAAQYVLKPLLGVMIAKVFRMPSAFFAGFMLTCCVSGAQLSSYASFLSKGDVALSILLTSCSTISSVVVTPVLTGLLIGSVVPVDGIAMAKSILQVVLVPVTLGLLLNTYAKGVVNVIQPAMPFVAMARRACLQDNFRLYWDAELHPCWTSCDTISWNQSGSSCGMFCSHHGHFWFDSCIILG